MNANPSVDDRDESMRTELPLPDLDALGARLKDIEPQARAAIQQRPIVAMMIAVGVGYLIARMASRSNR
jgi:hypothetical protein